MKRYTIYKITTGNGATYVGRTKNMKKRMSSHVYYSRKGSSIPVHVAIASFGFTVQVIKTGLSDVQSRKEEALQIKKLNCLYPSGLNMTTGGVNGCRYTDEAKRKISLSSFGKPGIWKGKKRPKWHGARISASKKGVENVSASVPIVCSNGKRYRSITSASKEIGAPASAISRVLLGQRRYTRGLSFKYE